MNLPTLRQLQYFIALAEEESFGEAAHVSNVSQSTLSAGIKDLEAILGQPLIDRSTRQFALTSFGHEMLQDAKNTLSEAENLTRKARMRDDPFTGTIKLGVIPTIAPYAIPAVLPIIHKTYPNLTIQIFEDMSERIVNQTHNGKLDLILLAFPYPLDGLDSASLTKESFIVAAPKGHFKKKNLKITDLKGENILLLEDGHCLRDHALEACSLSPAAGRKTFGATSLPTLIEMVRHGYGITLLPEMATAAVSGYKDMDIVPFQNPKPTRELGLAWRRGSPVTAIQGALSKVIKSGLLQIDHNGGK